MDLPFAHLNLRFNPFGEADAEERGRLAVVELPELRPRDVLQLVGDSGRGKTTHLLALRARHPEAVYERLDEGQDRCRGAVPRSGVFLLDEAQRLRPSRLRGLIQREGPTVLGTHEDLSALAGRPLRTVRLSGLDLPRLRAIVERRIAWARRAEGPVPTLPDPMLRALIERYRDDVRAIEGALYDSIQAMKEPGHVQV